MAQIFVFGCVTADLQLKQSQKQTPYVSFDLAEHIGYGCEQRTIYYQVWAWGGCCAAAHTPENQEGQYDLAHRFSGTGGLYQPKR